MNGQPAYVTSPVYVTSRYEYRWALMPSQNFMFLASLPLTGANLSSMWLFTSWLSLKTDKLSFWEKTSFCKSTAMSKFDKTSCVLSAKLNSWCETRLLLWDWWRAWPVWRDCSSAGPGIVHGSPTPTADPFGRIVKHGWKTGVSVTEKWHFLNWWSLTL